jgi:uncharacterized protein
MSGQAGSLVYRRLIALGVVMLIEAVLPLIPARILSADSPLGIIAGVMFGAAIGAISSLLGVAGGEVIIPTLVLGYGAPVAAAGTLSLMISLPTIIAGLIRYWRAGLLQNLATAREVILPLAVGAALGAPLGGALAADAPTSLVKAGLGILLVWSAWKVFGQRRKGPH